MKQGLGAIAPKLNLLGGRSVHPLLYPCPPGNMLRTSRQTRVEGLPIMLMEHQRAGPAISKWGRELQLKYVVPCPMLDLPS
jgi:hypothetical protein